MPLTILLHVQEECQTVLDTTPPSQQTVAVTRVSLERWQSNIATARVLLSDPFAPSGTLAFAAALMSALVGGAFLGGSYVGNDAQASLAPTRQLARV